MKKLLCSLFLLALFAVPAMAERIIMKQQVASASYTQVDSIWREAYRINTKGQMTYLMVRVTSVTPGTCDAGGIKFRVSPAWEASGGSIGELMQMFEANSAGVITNGLLLLGSSADERALVLQMTVPAILIPSGSYAYPPYIKLEYWEDCNTGSLVIDVFAVGQ